ncbi:hypothetical protein [Marinobacterium sp. BA1]|uniref:hypothetical protein n=1 Tax=Marinobacterium sp. BA1 TaxID=3138931 RepID=UPI0032E5D78F
MTDCEWVMFRRGVVFALRRVPATYAEFEDIVTQAGGFEELIEAAESDEDIQLLKEAKSCIDGI